MIKEEVLMGIFKSGLVLLLWVFAVTAQAELKFPPLTGRVVDDAQLIEPAVREQLTQQLQAHEAATGEQLVVVTLPDLQGTDIADFGYQLGRAWGIVRSVYLSEGSAQNPRAQLAWLLYQLSQPGDHPPSMPGTPAPLPVQGWQRSPEIRIPFIRADAGFPSVPYVSVLRGEVAPQLLRDRLILIGSTAPGLGDRYVTPQSASLGTTPGIEIQANILNGLLQQRSIVVLDERLSVLLSVMLVGLLLGLLLLRPRLALWMTVGGIAVALLGSCLLLRLGWWWSPAASLLGMLLGYLIWNWRRLSAVLAYFGWELARLDSEPKVFPERRRTQAPAGDVLQGQIVALEQAMSRTRDTRRFIADGLSTCR